MYHELCSLTSLSSIHPLSPHTYTHTQHTHTTHTCTHTYTHTTHTHTHTARNECIISTSPLRTPCVNGWCTDSVNGYYCSCNEGFQGVNCDEQGLSCQNNATQTGTVVAIHTVSAPSINAGSLKGAGTNDAFIPGCVCVCVCVWCVCMCVCACVCCVCVYV